MVVFIYNLISKIAFNEMISEDTLKIRNFPASLSDTEKEDFLRHFGAQQVKIISTKVKRKNVAYAKFPSKAAAKGVLHRLHQLRLLDSLLLVEYAKELTDASAKTIEHESNELQNKQHYKNFISKLNAFNSSVNFNQPPPHHLRYVYPKPNRATINNIAHALASVPKFYTQVLHLMNRMNLPPPFSNIPDPPPVPAAMTQPHLQPTLMQPTHMQPTLVPPTHMQPTLGQPMLGQPTLGQPTLTQPPPVQMETEEPQSSSESEIESDDDTNKIKEIIPIKRKLPQKNVIKRPKFIKPNAPNPPSTKAKQRNVFEKVQLQSRKIELKLNVENLENKLDATIPTTSNEQEDEEEHIEERGDCISEQELSSNQIPLKDLSVLPVFKDYHPGIPSTRLYVKNIAKSVDKNDLAYIFKRYVVEKSDPEVESAFDIRLMQEGRMKGQAFVTLDNVEVAQKALKETNGFILKDKPLVVVFARSVLKK